MEDEKRDNVTANDETEILVYIKFEDSMDNYSPSDLLNAKMLGLDTREPILQLGNKVFGGSWKETVGTVVLFEEANSQKQKCFFSETVSKPLKYYAKTSKALHMRRIFVSEKEADPDKEVKLVESNNMNE